MASEHHRSASYTRDTHKTATPSFLHFHSRPQTSPPHSPRRREHKEKSSENALAFPSSDRPDGDLDNFLSRGELTPRLPRPRTRTGPSSRSKWHNNTAVPPLRFSGTSSLETPPQTPCDPCSGRASALDFSVIVAAPGVEALDALVDGMNGMGGISMEDLLPGNLSSRFRFTLPAHHPLHQPPLPTPPPGIVLGKGKGAKREKVDTSDDDDERSTSPFSRPHPRRLHSQKQTCSRKASASTITVDSLSTGVTTPPPPNDSAEDLPMPVPQPTERPRTIIPTISEIIRSHAPYAAQQHSRPGSANASASGHSNGHALSNPEDDESEPEPLTADEAAEFISRSSMDSIEHEVRQTFHNQKHSPVTASRDGAPQASPLASVPSNGSDGGSIRLGLRSATSDTYTHTSSTPSGNEPFDPTQFSASPPSVSQAIAEYLRSARLTTLLKLTRYPHASMDHPVTVSLADMGDPNGFPLVVFLGLGCVRHIMGLYDEMADCLGLRLIAIDR